MCKNGFSMPEIISHWKLDGDCRDAVGHCDATGHGVTFIKGVDGRHKGAAFFNGQNNYIEVPNHDILQLGSSEFSISVWIKPENEAVVNVAGDIMSKYDSAKRKGLNLSLISSSSGYNSICDSRRVHFGIDDGITDSWQDCGKPCQSNPHITALVVYEGKLYAGIADAESSDKACHVFHYAEEARWVDCGRLGNDPSMPSVQSMIVHEGGLYAGTGLWDWVKAKDRVGGPGHVYHYEGGTNWRDIGQLGQCLRVLTLASYKGNLYAGCDDSMVYRYEGGSKWEVCGKFDDEGPDFLCSMIVFQGNLYGGTSPRGSIYRYDNGTTWTCIGKNPLGYNHVNQIHKLQIYQGNLYAGTWPFGHVLRYEGNQNWTDCGHIGVSASGQKVKTDWDTESHPINEINELTVYNGKLYAGVIPKAEVYRYEGNTDWTLMKRLVNNPDWSFENYESWRRVLCLTVFQGRMYAGTGTCCGRYISGTNIESGRVFSIEAGMNACSDDELGKGWKHLVAVKNKSCLMLYVDGKLSSISTFNHLDYNVSNNNSLFIGFGPGNYFCGAIDDVRIYAGAIGSSQIEKLSYIKTAELI